MKRQFTAAGIILIAGFGLAACNKPKLDNDDAKAAYAIGYMTGKQSETQVPTLNTKAFVAGFNDAYSKKPGAITEEEMKKALVAFEQKVRADAMAAHQKAAELDGAKAQAYLAENAKKAGVTTTASGLQYEVISEGKGDSPKAENIVKVHYEGKLLDGKIFDSSVQRGEPASFRLNQVIPGWTEGVQLMKVGSKYKFTIPPQLAYGPEGAGPIPPNSVLVFEVELLEVEK
jgi:FKBP-type peptidyl-prolyl cis-trans isomerase